MLLLGCIVLMVLLSVVMMPLVVWGSWRSIDQKQRGKTDMFWAQWYCDDLAVDTSKLWRLVLEYGEVESDVRMAGLQ